MIKSLKVDSFRGYQKLRLSNLKRVNVIVGANASGKTALLEAIYLALGANPELYFRLRAQRSLERIPLPFTREAGNDLFYNGNEPAVVTYVGTPGLTRTVKIFYDTKAPTTIPLEQQLHDPMTAPPLAFQWKKGSRVNTLHAVFTKDGLKVVGGPPEPVSASFFSGVVINAAETADRFSRLSVSEKDGAVVEAMRSIFPIITDLSVQSSAGSPMVYANLQDVKGKRELGLVSSGIQKLLAILVAIFEHTGRVL